MRILLINHEFTISGSSLALFRLAMHLRDQGHHLAVFSCNPADGPVRAQYHQAGIPLDQSAAATAFDVAIASTICAAPALLQVAPLLRTIWFVNEAEIALTLLLHNPGWAEAFRQATAIIFNMPFQRDVLGSFIYDLDPATVHVIPFGVEIDASVLAHARVPAKARAWRVVQLGTIEPRKRPGDLILAAARSGIDLECVICGTDYGMLRPEARAVVEADPARYRLVGGLPDEEVLAWVASADMFCLASSSETQALAAYQAALLGRPMLLSDLRCYRDVFRHGRNCLLFPAGNVEMLARSIGMLAASAALRRELGDAALRTAKRFTHQRFFDGFDAVLRSVVESQ